MGDARTGLRDERSLKVRVAPVRLLPANGDPGVTILCSQHHDGRVVEGSLD
jgi:hypothetical protein